MRIAKLFLAFFLPISVLCVSCKSKDSDVQAKILQKFAATPELVGASAIVTDGVATLSGEVKSQEAKEQGETIAKEISGVKSVINKLTVETPAIAAPNINTDSTLHAGVIDATKNFKNVTATVSDGEITLTGSIQRSQLPTLMQSLSSLKPKKINNQLTIK